MSNKNKNFIPQRGNTNPRVKKSGKLTFSHCIVLCLMVFWTIGSIFGIIATVKGCYGTSSSAMKTVSADEVQVGYKFNSSNIYTVCGKMLYKDYTGDILASNTSDSSKPKRIPASSFEEYGNSIINFRFGAVSDFESSGIVITFDFVSYSNVNPYRLSLFDLNTWNIRAGQADRLDSSFHIDDGDSLFVGLFDYGDSTHENIPIEETAIYTGFFEFYVSPGFNCDVVSCRYYGECGNSFPSSPNTYDCANYFIYYDSNGNFLRVTTRFSSIESYLDQFLYKDRFYYLTSESASETQFNLGREKGYSEGKKVGYDEGYSIGRENGYIDGKNYGYTQGAANANKYSFLGLIGAVVDAPLQAIGGLLNFDLLGFNMLNLFYALVTCALIIAVIRMVL